MTRRPLTLPALTPSAWELTLPDYPVISNDWGAASYPELLGSLPSGAEWSLTFENVTTAEAFALMLPWRATAGGLWPLTTLPDELAGGVDDAAFRKRLTSTTWTIARPPRQEQVKNGRFTVTIELVYELTFESLYGFRNPPVFEENPLRLKLPSLLTVIGDSITYQKRVISSNVSGVLELDLTDGLTIAGANPVIDNVPRRGAADSLLLDLPAGLTVVAAPTSFSKKTTSRPAQGPLALALTDGLTAVGTAQRP